MRAAPRRQGAGVAARLPCNDFPMLPIDPHSKRKTAIALVYWGRLGAGAALMSQIAEAMEQDPRFTLYVSPSQQSEIPPAFPAARLLPVRTFTGPVSLLLRTLLLPLTVRRLIRRLAAAKVDAIVTVMPHIWGHALQRAAQSAGIRTVLIVHDADPHPGEARPVFDWLVCREIRRSDRIVTFSDHVANRLVARGLTLENRLARLFHPVFRYVSSGTASCLTRGWRCCWGPLPGCAPTVSIVPYASSGAARSTRRPR
jgi:hypothetical protein